MPQHHVFVFLIRNTKGWKWRWNEWWREACFPLASLWLVIHSTLTAIQIHEKLKWLQFIAHSYIKRPIETQTNLPERKRNPCLYTALLFENISVPFLMFWDLPTFALCDGAVVYHLVIYGRLYILSVLHDLQKPLGDLLSIDSWLSVSTPPFKGWLALGSVLPWPSAASSDWHAFCCATFKTLPLWTRGQKKQRWPWTFEMIDRWNCVLWIYDGRIPIKPAEGAQCDRWL